MDEIMDTKVVQMKFDNSQFRAGVQDTIKQLDNLENSLEMSGASNGLNKVAKASKDTTKAMDAMGESVQTVQVAFSYLEVAGITAMVRLTNAALTYGKRIADNLWSKSIGQIISGGKIRSQNISNAKFQLEGLGVAWNDVVGDIEYGVQDTAYGLDEAAKAASQLVASQVQLGDEMKTALRGISGTAAMTNSSFSEISDIWTTVASNGKLMTMQLRQLSARGLNASAVLAKAFNTSEEAINQMVTQGKISFQEFADAMDNAFGEHAKEANKTFQGALSNMNAALSRIGAKFADPVFENLRITFNALKGDINNINKALQPIVDLFGTILNSLGYFGESILTNEHFIKGLINIVIDLYSYIRPLYWALREIYGFNPFANVDSWTEAFENFTASLQLYGDKSRYIKNLLKEIISAIDIFITAVRSVFSLLVPFGEAFADVFGAVLTPFKEGPGWITENRLAIKAMIMVLAKFARMGIKELLYSIGNAIKSIDWNSVITALIAIINAMPKAINLIANFINVIKKLFGSVIVYAYIAGNAVLSFIDYVANAWRSFLRLIGIETQNTLGSYSPTIQVNANTSEVTQAASTSNDAIVTVSQTANEATESVETLNESLVEVEDRLEGIEKGARNVSDGVKDAYKNTAKSAEEAANKVEDANDRIASSTKTFTPDPRGARSQNPDRRSGSDSTPGAIDKIQDKIQEFENQNSTVDTRGANKFISGISSWFDVIKGDKSGQKAAASALDIWFGGIVDTVKESSKSWLATIAMLLLKISPAVAVILPIALKLGLVITAFKIIFEVLGIVFGLLKGIVNFFKDLHLLAQAMYKNAVANEWNAIANVIKSIGITMLSIAAAFGIFALVALIIDKYDLTETYGKLVYTMYISLAILGIIASIVAVILKYSALMSAFNNARKVILGIKNFFENPGIAKTPDDTITSVLKSLALALMSYAVAVGAVAAALYFIGQMEFKDIMKGILGIEAVTVMILLLLAVMLKFGNALQTYKKGSEIKGLSKTFKGMSSEFEESGSSIHRVLLALAATIAVLTAAILIFGHEKPGVLLQGAGFLFIVMVALSVFIGVLIALSGTFSDYKVTGKNSDVLRDIQKGPADSQVLGSIVKIIGSLAGFMWSLSKVVKSLKGMSTDEIGMATMFISFTLALMSILMFVIMNNEPPATMNDKEISAKYNGVSKVIASLALMMVGIAFSLSIMKGLSEDELTNGFGILIISLISIATLMTGVALVSKSLDLGPELEKLSKSMLVISVSLSILMASISLMFNTMKDIDWSNFEGSAGYLIGIAVFIGSMVVLVGMLSVLCNGDSKTILLSSLGIFIGLSILLFSVSQTLLVMDSINWEALQKGQGILLGIAIFLVGITVVSAVLAGMGSTVILSALAAVGIVILLFTALGVLFYVIGQASENVGSGLGKVIGAINILQKVDWNALDGSLDGIKKLFSAFSLVSATKYALAAMLFVTGSNAIANGSKSIYSAIDVLGKAGVKAGVYAANIIAIFNSAVDRLYDLAEHSSGLGSAFGYAANMIITGFIEGLTNGGPSLVTSMAALATAGLGAFLDAMGIHSPSLEMAKAAFWSVYGFLDGLTENAPALQEGCVTVGEMVVNTVNDIVPEGLQNAAGSGAAGFVATLQNTLAGAMPNLEQEFNSMMTGLGAAGTAGLSSSFDWTLAERAAFASTYGTTPENYTGGDPSALQWIKDINNQHTHDNFWNSYRPSYISADQFYTPVSRDGSSLDTSTTSDLASSISGSSGAGSGINDASKGSAIGTGGSTVTNNNNTYNFYQNNYSPEPLDRSAIYQQTRNQFNSFYAYAKEKNLSY